MKTTKHGLPLSAALSLALIPASSDAAAIITTGQTVGGTTTNLPLTAGSLVKDPDITLSNDGSGNLLFAVSATAADTDWWVQWDGQGIDTNTYKYVQVNFSAVTPGAVNSAWQTFFADGDSSIGGGSNSGHGIGTGTIGTVPFSVVVDMTAFTGPNGGTEGATGWGAASPLSDTVTTFRLDIFENNATNKGKTFTISSVTLGSQLIPEPSSALLGGFGLLALLRRRR